MRFNENEKEIIKSIFDNHKSYLLNLIDFFELFKTNRNLKFKYVRMLEVYNKLNIKLTTLKNKYTIKTNEILKIINSDTINEYDNEINILHNKIKTIEKSDLFKFLDNFFKCEKMTKELTDKYKIESTDKFYPIETKDVDKVARYWINAREYIYDIEF